MKAKRLFIAHKGNQGRNDSANAFSITFVFCVELRNFASKGTRIELSSNGKQMQKTQDEIIEETSLKSRLLLLASVG